MWYGQDGQGEFKKGKTLRTNTVHFFVMTRNAKMVVEGTFEPCEKGTNDSAVQSRDGTAR